MALTQISRSPEGRAYYESKSAEGRTAFRERADALLLGASIARLTMFHRADEIDSDHVLGRKHEPVGFVQQGELALPADRVSRG